MYGPHFCTYFDSNYLDRGVVLHHSLRNHLEHFTLHVLCLDELCYAALCKLDLPTIRPIPLSELEDWDHDLLRVRDNRSRIEYYFTLSPCLPHYLLNTTTDIESITYLDADLMFFSSPTTVLDEIGTSPVAIVPHRYPSHLRDLEKYGIYNVAWLTFDRSDVAARCLETWREQCIAWCYDRLEADRFADQKYLDNWPALYPELCVISNEGVNVAPWNLAATELSQRDNVLFAGSDQLVFYHYHGLKHCFGSLYDSGLARARLRMSELVRASIYQPYLQALKQARHELRHTCDVEFGDQLVSIREFAGKNLFGSQSLRNFLIFLYGLLIARSLVRCPD